MLKDGTRKGYPSFCNKDVELLNRVYEIIRSTGYVPTVTKHSSGVGYFSLGPFFAEYMLSKGVNPLETCYTKRAPTFDTEEEKWAFLSGLWDTDGYVSTPQYREVRYVTVNRGLAEDVLALLTSLGLDAALYVSKRSTLKTPLDLIIVAVRRGSHQRFRQNVQLTGRKHQRIQEFTCGTPA